MLITALIPYQISPGFLLTREALEMALIEWCAFHEEASVVMADEGAHLTAHAADLIQDNHLNFSASVILIPPTPTVEKETNDSPE